MICKGGQGGRRLLMDFTPPEGSTEGGIENMPAGVAASMDAATEPENYTNPDLGQAYKDFFDIDTDTGQMEMTNQILEHDLAYTKRGDRITYHVTVVVTDQGGSGLSGSVAVLFNTTEDNTSPSLESETFWVEENVQWT